MAPTQPFKPRAEERARPRDSKDDGRRSSRHRPEPQASSPPRRSESRDEHRKAKRSRRYDVVQKMEVGMDVDAASGSDEEYGSDLDLDKPLCNIGEYLEHRAELVRNMFGSLKKDTLHKLVPPVLRVFSLKELEEKCVFELDGMSRQRVRAILSGQDLPSSSGTDDSEDEAMPRPPCPQNVTSGQVKSPVGSIPGRGGVSSAATSPIDSVSSSSSPAAATSSLPGSHCLAVVEPAEMELVELELRAHALRAMMQQLDQPDSPDSRLGDDESDADADALLGDALVVDDFFNGSQDPPSPAEHPKQRAEKDLFEIHVDEGELAGFE